VIQVTGGRELSANFDMQSLKKLERNDRIVIQRSAHAITFLHPAGWSYYDTLRGKLRWNEHPNVSGN
jgi:NAD+ kinase